MTTQITLNFDEAPPQAGADAPGLSAEDVRLLRQAESNARKRMSRSSLPTRPSANLPESLGQILRRLLS